MTDKNSDKFYARCVSITVNLRNPDQVIEKYKKVGLIGGVISL